MVKKNEINKHENIYIHIKKNTFYAICNFIIAGILIFIFGLNLTPLSSELKNMLSLLELIFMMLGFFTYWVIVMFFIYIGIEYLNTK